jgi:hypothetical protein
VNGIEITPEMVAAGASVLSSESGSYLETMEMGRVAEIASLVFEAMALRAHPLKSNAKANSRSRKAA